MLSNYTVIIVNAVSVIDLFHLSADKSSIPIIDNMLSIKTVL
jgi:hypothetical protein